MQWCGRRDNRDVVSGFNKWRQRRLALHVCLWRFFERSRKNGTPAHRQAFVRLPPMPPPRRWRRCTFNALVSHLALRLVKDDPLDHSSSYTSIYTLISALPFIFGCAAFVEELSSSSSVTTSQWPTTKTMSLLLSHPPQNYHIILLQKHI